MLFVVMKCGADEKIFRIIHTEDRGTVEARDSYHYGQNLLENGSFRVDQIETNCHDKSPGGAG